MKQFHLIYSVHSETSTGIKSCITLCNTCGFRSSLPATLTFVDWIWPSLPGNSSSTYASFQNALFVRSDFTITVSPTEIALSLFCFLHLSLACSCRLKRYSCCHLFVKWCSNHWWCLALFVKAWLTLTALKCWLLGALVIHLPVIRWDGVSGMEMDSPSSQTYVNGHAFMIASISTIVVCKLIIV